MVTAKNSVRIGTRNYADWKLLKYGCRESPPCEDSDVELEGLTIDRPCEYPNPEQTRVEMQRHWIDPRNYCKVMKSQRQTATQGNTRVAREMGNPNQAVTQSEDMNPGIGPEGKQDLQRTLYTKTLFAHSEHLPVYYIRRDINKYFYFV